MSYLALALAPHKELFEAYRALIVLDDKAMRRYVMAWGPQLVQVIDHYPLEYDMASLWRSVQVDMQALGDLTGDSPPEVRARLRQAQGLELIYPDGTVAQAAANVLRAKMAEIEGL